MLTTQGDLAPLPSTNPPDRPQPAGSGRGSPSRCYLDHNATTPLRPSVRAAMVEAMELTGNPSSVHGWGRACRAAIEAARRAVAALVGAMPAQIVFTSGGTEANTLALTGFAPVLAVSAVEHDSILAAAPDAHRVPVDANGVIDLKALSTLLARAPTPALVSLQWVNNETGVIQPVAEAAALVHRHGGLLHSDAVQAAGRLPLDRTTLGADLLTISAHKLGGPAGVGALILDERLPFRPLLRGGGQERRRRAGTENLIGIVGFGRAALDAVDARSTPTSIATLTAWRDRLEHRAKALVPATRFFGADAPRIGTTSCLALPGIPAETQVIALDLAGIAVSAGAACSSGRTGASHVLRAMGVAADLAACAIRVSLGWSSQESDIDTFLAAWSRNALVCGNLAAISPYPI